MIESNQKNETLDTRQIKNVFRIAGEKSFSSKIYAFEKNSMNIHVYVVNGNGIVLYDSTGKSEGEDFSRWNDVRRTLQGEYGARSTRMIPDRPETSSFYIAAPIRYQNKIIGAVTVIKPKSSTQPFMENAKEEIAKISGLVLFTLILSAFFITFWFTRPIEALTAYANRLRQRIQSPLPDLGESEIGNLGRTLENLYSQLEGKKYVEEYVQTLTHEIKSPLTSIRAASELLEEDSDGAIRQKMHTNIQRGIERITEITDKMLLLAVLENKNQIEKKENFNLSALCSESLEMFKTEFENHLKFEGTLELDIFFTGEKFLIRQAVENLLRNAARFTPQDQGITLSLKASEREVEISVINGGPKIPDYALSHIFDKFYSLPGPGTEKRSSGLGLPFVKRIAELHGGRSEICNTNTGVRASIFLPF